MSPSSNRWFRSEGKVAVAALVLALLAMMSDPVGGSRFTKSPASARRTMVRLQQSAPPTDLDDLASSSPPDSVQFPPPVRRAHQPSSNASSPPSSQRSPSRAPPSRVHRSPPPPSSPPPPPPPEAGKLVNGNQNGRRLFSSEPVVNPSSSSDLERSGKNKFSTEAGTLPGKCGGADAGAPSAVTPLAPYGGGYVPVGAPFLYGDPGVPTPEPAPSPAAGADGPFNNQPALSPLSDGNSTLAHTTMFSQCTYTIITCTGNIEGAGTQADVNVEFFNKLGDSVLFVNLENQRRNFNRGATDTFTVVGDCVQNICRMHLSHDDSGPNPGWFVNTVTVSLMYQTQVFNVFEWLAKDEPPYSLSRTVSSCPA